MKLKPTNLRSAVTLFLLLVSGMLLAANTKVKVQQVTASVSVTGNQDYTITSATPFGSNGIVDIQNTDHAVVILSAVKPSAGISLLANHVKVKGEKAVNGENCQVKIYDQGCIILPYGDDTKPLTVYSGQNYSGTAVNDFDLRNTNGFMNTLTDGQLNNRIRSFKLKRGYMVTFSLRPGGYGYSRCFIAADSDLEIASLPELMDQKISSYRIFKWYDTGKRGVAARDGAWEECSALNVTSTYGWGVGSDMGPDVESVPHHIHEGWPSPGDLGSATWSPHMKTNNEPRNGSDPNPNTLEEILGNWEQLMATGMRLCSPSSWDGSDYWDGGGFLNDFFTEIDKRGWRCDIVDLHCYWPEANFGNIKNYADRFSRPVWVSEWVWGASWGQDSGSKGAFNDGVTESQNATVVKRICEAMNGMDYVERYFYWNDERDPSKLYKNGLTATGQTYAAIDGGVGYNGSKNYVPSMPSLQAPTDLKANYNEETNTVELSWKEYNGELNRSITVERRTNGSWQVAGTVTPGDNVGTYTFEVSGGSEDCQYRIHEKGINNEDMYSEAVMPFGRKVYLYNIGSRQWLTSGNNWGTRASLTPYGGHDVFIQKVADGKYTIDTQVYNGTDLHYLKKVDNTAYVDQPMADTWTLEPVGTVNGQTTYLLSDGENLAYDGTTSALVMSNETGENAQWLLQTAEDRMAMLGEATAKNPIDATFLLPGANFHQYDQRNANWEGNPVLGGAVTNKNAEKFNCTFDVYQTIGEAPAGNYRLMAQGFYRNGDYAPAATKHNNGTEELNALLYANTNTLPLKSIFTEAGKQNVGVTTNGIAGKFPNSMADASEFFTAGLYENKLDFTLSEGEELRVGIKKTVEVGNDWTIFDNFRLVYLGNDAMREVTLKAADGHYWATFYSSVANYRLPEGATAYTATVKDDELLLHTVGSIIPNGCAVIIVGNNDGLLTLDRTDEMTNNNYENDLQGSDTETRTSSYGGTVYVMGATTDADFGFHRYTAYELPAGKAFLVLAAGQSRPLTICFDDGVTAVDSISLKKRDESGVTYNLQGQRVLSPGKGLYVTGRHKIIVK